MELSIDDPHGDVLTTIVVPASGNATGTTGWATFDEYGLPTSAPAETADTGAASYGWLGSSERATLDTGLILMGGNALTSAWKSRRPSSVRS